MRNGNESSERERGEEARKLRWELGDTWKRKTELQKRESE